MPREESMYLELGKSLQDFLETRSYQTGTKIRQRCRLFTSVSQNAAKPRANIEKIQGGLLRYYTERESKLMTLSKSQAHYIKAVHELSAGREAARVCDIAEKLSLSKASVSLAMTKLCRQGLVRKDTDRHVLLTKIGEREAMRMLDKYDKLWQFLVEILGVSMEVAKHDACAMEHAISVDTLCALCRFISRMGNKKECSSDCPLPMEAQDNT